MDTTCLPRNQLFPSATQRIRRERVKSTAIILAFAIVLDYHNMDVIQYLLLG